ncbi:hypothetical protein H6G76_11690 [Nostoc sp. FACHB-152]|nr:hypothetical protein [Nostoc sp. FACHB-152]
MSGLLKISNSAVLCFFIAPTAISFNTDIVQAQTISIVPSQYRGVWRGYGVQINPSSEWSVLIAITGGEVDSVVGTIAYPSLRCGGELSLRRVSNNNSIELSESITYGNCINNGTINLKTSSARGLEYVWQKDFTQATARLQKISSN